MLPDDKSQPERELKKKKVLNRHQKRLKLNLMLKNSSHHLLPTFQHQHQSEHDIFVNAHTNEVDMV